MIICYVSLFFTVPRKGCEHFKTLNTYSQINQQFGKYTQENCRVRMYLLHFWFWAGATEGKCSRHGPQARLSQQHCTDWTWHIDTDLPDSPQGHLGNQRARKYLQKKDLRERGKWKAVHWHLPEGTAGDINNHFSHQTVENERRVRREKNKCFAASCLN